MNSLVNNNKSYSSCDLVLQAQSGSRPSMESLFSQVDNILNNFIRSKSSSSHDVDDLVQETYLHALSGFARFQNRAAFSTWVLGIALNVIRNHYNRSPEYRYDFVADYEYPEGISDEGGPAQNAEKYDRIEALVFQLNHLPEVIKETVVLFALEGESYNAIAVKMNVSESCVKSRLFRARVQLKDALHAFL